MFKSVKYILFVGGLGGLLYGIDFGVIAASMPYIRALRLYTDAQLGWIVGAVMLGGIVASATAGVLCDRAGRKKTIVFATALFLLAIPIVCCSGTSFAVMLTGRILQGMSAGYMAVVMPMYLAEVLPADIRGRGTGIFQLFLGIGLVAAALVGVLVASFLGAADAPAETVSAAAKSLAWRINFWWTLAPVALLLGCSLPLPESPVWLNLQRPNLPTPHPSTPTPQPSTSLLQRKYVLPFLLAVAVLSLNKLVGYGCIVPYSVLLFQKSGLSGTFGNGGDLALKALNLAVTLLVVGLIDRKGRTFLMKVGTAGLAASLVVIGGIFFGLDRGWFAPSYAVGGLTLAAFLVMQFFYSFGPGVCVWLVLSELMPARIRANGMSIALFSNQFVAWGLASAFLPASNQVGFGVLFLVFAFFGLVYFLTVLAIPETNGKTLEEIEKMWERKHA